MTKFKFPKQMLGPKANLWVWCWDDLYFGRHVFTERYYFFSDQRALGHRPLGNQWLKVLWVHSDVKHCLKLEKVMYFWTFQIHTGTGMTEHAISFANVLPWEKHPDVSFSKLSGALKVKCPLYEHLKYKYMFTFFLKKLWIIFLRLFF